MAIPSEAHHLNITYHVKGSSASSNDVDLWELRASRRALYNLKTLLQGPRMLELIQTQIEEGDAYFKSILAASKGEFRECLVGLSVHGISASQVGSARAHWMELNKDQLAREITLPAHPEHYALPPYQDGIIEVIGEHMARIRVTGERIPEWVIHYGDPDFPTKKQSVCELDDGTAVFHILHEFRDTEEGCDLILRLIFPKAAPQVWFDEHAEHLAIEFRNFLNKAFQDLCSS